MTFFDIILLGIALSMDAFAVSISDGMRYEKVTFLTAFKIAITFGIYQAAMPAIGFLCGNFVYDYICRFDHWIALLLLGYLGGKMLFDGIKDSIARHNDEEVVVEKNGISFKELMIQGIATSIDALAVGLTLAANQSEGGLSVWTSVLIIGGSTTVICIPPVFLGKKTGDLLNNKAQILGGLILLGIGLKIFISHIIAGQ